MVSLHASLQLPHASLDSPAHQPTAASDVDADTAALIARLALEDIEEVLTRAKGKSRADAPLSDEEYAYKLQSDSFREWLLTSEDAKYARSLESALITDAAYLEAAIAAEEAAIQDRRVAEMASRGEVLPPPTAVQARLENPAFIMHPEPTVTGPIPAIANTTVQQPSTKVVDTLKDLQHLDWSAQKSDELNWSALEDYTDWSQNASILADIQKPKFTHWHSTTPGPSVNRQKLIQCTICSDSLIYHKALHTPCDHNYCGDCVIHLVESFIRDESLFPLRCCKQPIPISDVESFISSTLRAVFLEKYAEFSVLSKDRLYCVEPTCSAFLGSTEGVDATGVVCPAVPAASKLSMQGRTVSLTQQQ